MKLWEAATVIAGACRGLGKRTGHRYAKRLLPVAFGAVIATAASAQEWKSSIEKWRACADAAAARYSKSTESAAAVARLAALSCHEEKKKAAQAVVQVEGSAFADQYIEAAERYYIDRLSVNVVEMRLHGSDKR